MSFESEKDRVDAPSMSGQNELGGGGGQPGCRDFTQTKHHRDDE